MFAVSFREGIYTRGFLGRVSWLDPGCEKKKGETRHYLNAVFCEKCSYPKNPFKRRNHSHRIHGTRIFTYMNGEKWRAIQGEMAW